MTTLIEEVKDIVDTNSNPFLNLGILENIVKAVIEEGYEKPSQIQAETIPYILNGQDVLGQAQTGTGKTAAFALPSLSRLDPSKKITQVLVLTPTRELAIQVAKAYRSYAKYMDVSIATIYGGQDYKVQLDALKKGAQIVVGTPGRVIDHIERKTLKLDNLINLTLDEADEMLRMGFIDDVELILSKTPENRQITLFSATMPKEIKKISTKYLNDHVEVKIKNKTQTVSTIDQRYLVIKSAQKKAVLLRVLETEPTDAVIIFVRTKTATIEISDFLEENGFRSIAINGDLQQKQRERTISQLRSGRLDVLVATDVAARGLDVERISHVINYDVPQDNETYIHRIGRTGRAGRSGCAILFITPKEKRILNSIEKTTKQPISVVNIPTVDEVNKKRIESFNQKIIDLVESKKDSDFLPILKSLSEKENLDPLSIAAAIAEFQQGRKPFLLAERDEIKTEGFSQSSEPRERSRSRSKKAGLPMSEMEAYRLEVGSDDEVKPSHVVGAIANEADIEGNMIGQIDIYPDHTMVFLPMGMPSSILQTLKRTRVMGKKMDLKKVKAYKARASQAKPRRSRRRKSS